MYVQMTFAGLGLLTGLTLILRFFWWRLPPPVRAAALAVSAVTASLPAISLLTTWSITSNEANTLMNWIAIAGYQVLLLRFSLIRPQWLTSFCAVVLLLPIFAASMVFPLTDIFHPKDTDLLAIERPYLCERSPWAAIDGKVPGFDIRVYYQPPFAPFLKHRVQRSAFNTSECDAARATASILKDTNEVLFHCPAKPGRGAVDHILPLN